MPKFTFEHIHLRSPDPEATAKFYKNMFDAEIVRSAPDGKPRIDMNVGGCMIFIAEAKSEDGVGDPPVSPYQGLDHFGLVVRDIDNVVVELKKKGAEFTMEPNDIRPGVRIAFLRAPEGVSIELLERTGT